MQINQNIKHGLSIILIIILFGLLVYIKGNEKEELDSRFHKLENINDSLKYEIDSLKLEFEKYSRSNLSKISKVNIPQTFKMEKIKALINSCEKYNVPIKIACRLIYAESSFKESAMSYAGARGFMQLMPGTIKHIDKTTDISRNDPHWNIKMGVYYLSYLYNMFKSYDKQTRWRLAILSYNIGPGRVKSDPDSLLYEYKDYEYLNKILGNYKL